MESDGLFYTNRCSGCGRAMTKLEILDRMQLPEPLCSCGSNRFKSSNFKLWEELFLPRSWRQWVAIRKGILPPPPNRFEVAANRDTMIKNVAELEDSAEIEAGCETDRDEGLIR